MTAKILDGAKLAKSIRVKLEQETRDWVSKGNKRPGLAVVLVGNDPASEAVSYTHLTLPTIYSV